MTLTIDIYFIALSFLVSLTTYYKCPPEYTYLKLFPPLLFLTLAVETTGIYLISIHVNNVILYNFFTVIEISFYFWIISLVIANQKMKRLIRWAIPFYVLVAYFNIIFIQHINTIHTVSFAFGCLLIVLWCVYYFLELFRRPRSVRLSRDPAFWICSGLLFFYSLGIPLFGLINSWQDISPVVLDNFQMIVTILNMFLYSLFIISFLCIRARKYTLSRS